MALVVTYDPDSTVEAGSAKFTGLATATAIQIFPGPNGALLAANPSSVVQPPIFKCAERHDMRIFLFAASNETFHLNYEFSPDGGTTWFVGDQVDSATVTADENTAGYVNAAMLETHVGFKYRASLYNNSGSTANGGFEWRYST